MNNSSGLSVNVNNLECTVTEMRTRTTSMKGLLAPKVVPRKTCALTRSLWDGIGEDRDAYPFDSVTTKTLGLQRLLNSYAMFLY
jgi:hypothetical protein